ncbi:MAG: pseudouridine-5'-phosphate glycosidase [Phycisphaeraceae bacterium]|nr:pseudouridine-5'-phosphate glycosidase [Phycisphaeraceae bacterium]
MHVISRASPPTRHVALETTLLVHGVPREEGRSLASDLATLVRSHGAMPAIVGIVSGRPIVGLSDAELAELLAADRVEKINSANLGIALHRKTHGATTVSATMELAAAAGVRAFATGGIGGVHRGLADRLDISADLAALARFPVAVVTSGVKSLLDVESTREALETLGVPVVGFQTDRFPAFYLRDSASGVDARFDDPRDVAQFAASEMARTGRGVVIANPIPPDAAIDPRQWDSWLAAASAPAPPGGREATPRTLARLHAVSAGATLRANLTLVKSNAVLAAQIARAWLV